MDKNIHNMTINDFLELPERKYSEDIGEFDALIVLPMKYLHDSGYRCLDFVATKGDKPLMRLSGCSDVIHLDGISAHENTVNSKWHIDCLKKSGLLRIFSSQNKLKAGRALSSFELFSVKMESKPS